MPTEIFYRMPASALEVEVEGYGTVADALARWQSDPWYDGPNVVTLMESMGAVQTYYGALGGIDPGVLGFPPRLVERVAAVRQERGPWPTHPDEPEAFRDVLGVVWVSHDELVAAHDPMTDLAARRFVGVRGYSGDPDTWLRDLDVWLEPVDEGAVEVWLFQVDEPQTGERGRAWFGLDDEAPPRPHWVWDLLPWVLIVLLVVAVAIVVFAT